MNKTALITGASKRVGRAITETLASLGWNVIIHYNSSDKEARELSTLLSEKYHGQEFNTIQADLSVEAEVSKLIPNLTDQYGRFELLVNNASVFDRGYLTETGSELLKNQMDVNFRAPFILSCDFARYCKKGNIINMTDTRITTNKSNYAAYSLSKKALWELTKMAALEFAPDIRVNAIAPGVSIPPEGKDDAYMKRLARNIPAREPVGLEPILKSIGFILKENYLTGQLLFADGGENLGLNS